MRTKAELEAELPSMPTWPQNEFVAAHMTPASVSGSIATRVLSTGTSSAVGQSQRELIVGFQGAAAMTLG